MDFRLSPEHELIRESAYRFGQKEIVPDVVSRDREAKSDRRMLDRMAESGLLGVSIPEAYGGSGTDYISLGIVCEELERADTSARVVMSVHSGLHALTLLQWGTEEQKKRWLPALAKGDKIGAFGLTEPNAGSDAINITTQARRDGDSYVLNGEKTWISLANYADQFLVVARVVGTPDVPRLGPTRSWQFAVGSWQPGPRTSDLGPTRSWQFAVGSWQSGPRTPDLGPTRSWQFAVGSWQSGPRRLGP